MEMKDKRSCPHFGICGGCSYLDRDYNEVLKIKEDKVKGLIDGALTADAENSAERSAENSVEGSPVDDSCDYTWEGIKSSPAVYGYRNKMEFSFGDETKGGPLTLGLHKKKSFHDIIDADGCLICDEDFTKILTAVKDYCVKSDYHFYNKMSHIGYMRHLLIRKGAHTGEILAAFVTTSQKEPDLAMLTEMLTKLDLKGTLTGFLHIINNSVGDAIKAEKIDILYGRDYFDETLLGLRFRITPFSFFQTNSLGAELLYSTARQYITDVTPGGDYLKGKTVFDLYSGTGTIAQLMSSAAERVIGVEIVGEAVKAARENAEFNGITNCEFLEGDVLKVLDELEDKPDMIIVDPPRNGINPKALKHIMDYGVQYILYVSCKPESLARDLGTMTGSAKGKDDQTGTHGQDGMGSQTGNGSRYEVVRACCFDNFPWTENVETLCLLSKTFTEA